MECYYYPGMHLYFKVSVKRSFLIKLVGGYHEVMLLHAQTAVGLPVIHCALHLTSSLLTCKNHCSTSLYFHVLSYLHCFVSPYALICCPPNSASAGGYFLLNRCFSFLLLFSPEYCRITYSSPYSLKHLEATALNIPGKQKTKNYLVAEESCVSSSMVGFTVIR